MFQKHEGADSKITKTDPKFKSSAEKINKAVVCGGLATRMARDLMKWCKVWSNNSQGEIFLTIWKLLGVGWSRKVFFISSRHQSNCLKEMLVVWGWYFAFFGGD